MRNWRELEGAFDGREVLVVGNGPSRLGCSDWITELKRDGLVVIGCNALWRERFAPLDVLACYEAIQAEAALRDTTSSEVALVAVPPQGEDGICTVIPRDGDHARLVEVAPLQAAGDWSFVLGADWWPTQRAVGNLSGLLAYQLAMIARPRAVYLLGVDCCGLTQPGSDTALLSAIDEQTPGYGPARVPRGALGGGPHPMPDGWAQYRSLWRALTRRAEQAAIPTFRVVDAGALDWIEVRQPCRV